MEKNIKETTGWPTIGRREFLVTSIVTGFALAAQPLVQAQTKITTDSAGLTVGEVKIPVRDGVIPAYRAMPDKKGKKFPVVLVIHEIFGVHEWIQDVCRRFAKLGYMAIAPALYSRQADVTKISEISELAKIFSSIPDTQSMSDLDSTAEWAGANEGNIKKLSITGFCWGGRIVWLYAAHNANVKAGAAWYGRLENPPNAQVNQAQPTMPIDYAKDLKVPVIGFYGGLDKGITQDTVEHMRAALKKGKSGSEINVYPQADHGFHADYRPTYNKEASTDAWAKLQKWFKKNKAS
jgi:carboxymethylenebutenolidase